MQPSEPGLGLPVVIASTIPTQVYGTSWRKLSMLRTSLISGFMFATFIGFSPMTISAPNDRAAGGGIERIFMIALFVLALVVLRQNLKVALACLRRTKLIWVVIALCLCSIFWSDYPDLTLRRASLLLMITVITFAIAASESDPLRFLNSLFYFLSAVIIINLVATAIWPALAITDIGVRGLYSQKNAAGQVAMISIIVGFAWLTGSHNITSSFLGAGSIALALLFLVLSQSKTSLGITILALGTGAVMIFAKHMGVRFVLLMYFSMIYFALSIFIFLAINDFELASLANSVPIDTSFTGRDSLWEFATNRALDRFWLGYGYGAFWDVGELNDPLSRLEPGTWLGDVEKGVINHAHNGYLELWLNAGIVAAVLGAAAIVRGLIFDFQQFVCARTSADQKMLFLASGLLMLTYLLHNITESTLFSRGTSLYAVAMLMRFASARQSVHDHK
jgi:exopolysaccharide production protein ExoQ